MRQYILPSSYQGEPTLILEGKESQYLNRVLRLRIGEQFLGRDSKGNKYQLTMESITKKGCTISCQKVDQEQDIASTDALPSYQGPFPNLVLLQCLCKGKKEEQIVRQATEIGVSTIALVESRYCIPDLSEKKEKATQTRLERLQAQIKEALQQSGSAVPTQLENQVLPLSQLPSWWENRGLALFFHQSKCTDEQKTLSQLVLDYPIDKPIAVLVGPEGGFSEEECTFLQTSGFKPVLLRTNILRCETAGIYALSALQVLLTEKG